MPDTDLRIVRWGHWTGASQASMPGAFVFTLRLPMNWAQRRWPVQDSRQPQAPSLQVFGTVHSHRCEDSVPGPANLQSGNPTDPLPGLWGAGPAHEPVRPRNGASRPQGFGLYQSRRMARCRTQKLHSHSMVPGGLLVISNTTRFTPRTSLVMRVEMRSSNAYGSLTQSAVMPSWDSTTRSATVQS